MRFPWNRTEIDLNRELAHHLHELTAEYQRHGHSREEATRMAKREFGGCEQVKEQCRDERRWAWMTGIRQDCVLALRQMRRSPGFAFTAVITLALGIAANVIVFGVIRAMILEPVNLPGGDRVMTLALAKETYPFVAYKEMRDVRDRNTVFSAVAAINLLSLGMETNGAARSVWAAG